MYRLHTTCRACGFGGSTQPGGTKAALTSDRLVSVLDLGLQPLANDFCAASDEHAGYAPLEVLLCPKCNLAQLSVTVRPDILYSKYAYQTSASQTMQAHFQSLYQWLTLDRSFSSVVEIGSNDGLFLDFWKTTAPPSTVLGIDPAANLVEKARARGVPTINGLFDSKTAESAKTNQPDLIIARHVFCHVENWREFVFNLSALASKDTTIAIEVPYVSDMLAKGSFDQVYHEHLSYLSVKSVIALLHGTPLFLQKVLRFPVHGGVVVLIIKHRESGTPIHESCGELLRQENCGMVDWLAFAEKARDQIATLRSYVYELISQGKRVCGLGASAKSTVWINACKFTRREIQFVMDSTPMKVYKNVPGTNIPIAQEGTHTFDATDYCILFAWNYAEEIIAREKQYLDGGGAFIVPIPKLRLVPEVTCETTCAESVSGSKVES